MNRRSPLKEAENETRHSCRPRSLSGSVRCRVTASGLPAEPAAAAEFLEEGEKRSKTAANQIRYDLRNDPIGMPEGLLSPAAAENMRSLIQEFHKDTKNCFAEKSSCSAAGR